MPKLAGPLAIAMAGMEAEVRDAIAERAIQYGTKAAVAEGGAIVFEGSVLTARAAKPRSKRRSAATEGVSCSP